MKRAICFLFMLLNLSMPVNAATFIDDFSGLWQPNDGDVNVIKFDLMAGSTQDFSLYIFSADKISYLLVLDKDKSYSYSQTIYFTQENSLWYAGLSFGSKTLYLGNTPQYYIAFSLNDSNYIWTYDVEQVEYNKVYKLIVTSANKSDIFIQVDSSIPVGAPPVPLPGSALLLGSGLLGLALVWRRQQRRR